MQHPHYQACDPHARYGQQRSPSSGGIVLLGGHPPLLPIKPQFSSIDSSMLRDKHSHKSSSSPITSNGNYAALGDSVHYGESSLFTITTDTLCPERCRASAFRPVGRRLSLVSNTELLSHPCTLANQYAAGLGSQLALGTIDKHAPLPRRRDTGLANSFLLGLEGKSTLTRKAQKIAQRAQQKLSISSIGSELSSSASAIYASLFNTDNAPTSSLGSMGSSQQIYAASISLHGIHDQILMDQTDVVSAHIQKGIDFLERYAQFAKDRAGIEEEYAAKLKNLAKKARGKRGDDEDAKNYSHVTAFHAMLDEVNSLASQREIVAERLRKEVVPTTLDKCNALRTGRKKQVQELATINHHFNADLDNLHKQHRAYQKAHQDAGQAFIKHKKVFDNERLPRIDVTKALENANQKADTCERARLAYGDALEMANRAQTEYFTAKLPALLEEMRRLDVDRIEATSGAMQQCIDAETSVLSVVKRCYDDMRSAVGKIDPQRDTVIVVEQNKTGYAQPGDHKFEDLGDPRALVQQLSCENGHSQGSATLKRGSSSALPGEPGRSTAPNGRAISRKSSMHQRIFGGTGSSANKHDSQGEYGHLPPQQRCRHLEKKLRELRKGLETKEQSKAALQKMHGVYSENPKLGNVALVEGQMQTLNEEVNALRGSIEQYERLLARAESELNMPVGGVQHPQTAGQQASLPFSTAPTSSPRSSADPSLLSSQLHSNGASQRSSTLSGASSESEGHHRHLATTITGSANIRAAAPFTRFSPPSATAAPAPFANGFHPHSPTTQPPRQPAADTPNNDAASSSSHVYEECDGVAAADLPVLGTCTALYDYEGDDAQSAIKIRAGDEMVILERDLGDGWTHVRVVATQMNGYAPTSYLKVLSTYSPRT